MSEKNIKEILDVIGNSEQQFFIESSKNFVMHALSRSYNPEIIKHYYISDLIHNGNEYVVKFKKRLTPLTEEEYQKEFWSHVEKIVWKEQ